MATPRIHKMAFPIETPEAYRFWGSRHMCNRVKAIISFSQDYEDAMHNMRRFKFPYYIRRRAWHAWQNFVAQPDMTNIPFTPLSIPWWECMPKDPVPPGKGEWGKWLDNEDWKDNTDWVEWIPNTEDVQNKLSNIYETEVS